MCEGAIGFSASSFFGLTTADVAELRERDGLLVVEGLPGPGMGLLVIHH